MENKKTKKPLVILRQECYDTIANVINSSGLPAFIIEPILKEFLEETKIAMKNEYEMSLQWYNQNQENKNTD